MALVAVQSDYQLLTSGRYQSFSQRWIERLPALGHEAREVDLFLPDPLDQLAGCDGLMWWFAHRPFPRNFATRLVAALHHAQRFPTFPNHRTCWHFDDKVAQHYLLRAAGFPMPRTWVFWRLEDARDFCRSARFPLVLKLAGGITSENVQLLRNRDDAGYWIKRLFGSGVTSLDRPSLRRPRGLLGRALTAAESVTGGHRRRSRRGDVQRGYFLVQEFLEGNDYDTRVAVIGNRAYAYRRFNRPHDFRASGSGLRDPDPSKVDLEIVRMGFAVARSLGTQSIAIDGIYRDKEKVLTEISYYYEGWILHEECPGHWLLHGTPEQGSLEWVGGPLRPEDCILDDFLKGLTDPVRSQSSSGLRSGQPAGTEGTVPAALRTDSGQASTFPE